MSTDPAAFWTRTHTCGAVRLDTFESANSGC